MPVAEALAIIVVSYNSAGHLPALLGALSAQLGPEDELVVVDNASADGSAEVARAAGGRARVIESGSNLGFAGACHLGAAATSAPLLLFLNPDSEPAPDCLEHLRRAGSERPEWGAWQAAVMLPDGRINTDGGIVHFLGMGWAGDCGRPGDRLPSAPRPVAFPSGAAMVVRRSTWLRLDGLDASYFLYGEDLDLGLRVWLAGEQCGVVPAAQVTHDYDFEKGPEKWFWLERNRTTTVLSVYPAPLLAALAPALLAAELALLMLAARQGWLVPKLRAQWMSLRRLPSVVARRRRVQATSRVTAADFAAQLSASLDSDFIGLNEAGLPARLQRGYWRLVVRLLRGRSA